MKEQLNITVTGDTITILEGRAPDPINLKPLLIEGNIQSVSGYLKNRTPTGLYPDHSHVIIDTAKGTITLIVADQSPINTTVKGSLYQPENLKGFGINENKMYSLKEITDNLRKHRHLFADRDECNSIVANLNAFKATVALEVEKTSNQRNSSSRNLVDKQVHFDNVDFKITSPLFVGMPPVTFIVEVCVDITDGSTRFWLESMDLIELTENSKVAALQAEYDTIAPYGMPVIYK